VKHIMARVFNEKNLSIRVLGMGESRVLGGRTLAEKKSGGGSSRAALTDKVKTIWAEKALARKDGWVLIRAGCRFRETKRGKIVSSKKKSNLL